MLREASIESLHMLELLEDLLNHSIRVMANLYSGLIITWLSVTCIFKDYNRLNNLVKANTLREGKIPKDKSSYEHFLFHIIPS